MCFHGGALSEIRMGEWGFRRRTKFSASAQGGALTWAVPSTARSAVTRFVTQVRNLVTIADVFSVAHHSLSVTSTRQVLTQLALNHQDVRSRKRRKGSRKGWCQASSQGSTRQHPRYHEACYPPSSKKGWSQENLWSHLRRDTRCTESLLGECHPWRRHLLWARQAQDCHSHGRGLCTEEAGPYSVRFRRLI